jgi:hypothetical protein
MGAEVADGLDECRKAVRRQVGAGADWVKVCPIHDIDTYVVLMTISDICW